MSTHAEQKDTVIVGGGQAGVVMSYLLTRHGRDHVVLERHHRVGESWRHRWDSFTLVTPNWQLQLPGFPYTGSDPDGFLTRDQVIGYLEDYAATVDPPIRFGTEVTAVERNGDGNGDEDKHGDHGYVVSTDDQVYEAANVVVAAGTHQQPSIPPYRESIPGEILQLHSSEYRNPDALPEGAVLVVGSGQSGCQIAQELNESGRRVFLCVGSAGRLPRRYRGTDGMWWAMKLGMTEKTVDKLDSPADRFAANPQISGKDGGREIDLHQFARDGIVLLGRLQDVRDGRATLAPDLHDRLSAIDTMVSRFRSAVDEYISASGLDAPEETVNEPGDGYDQEIITELDLAASGIGTVIWATGYRWDYSWVRLPVFDDYGYPVQHRGVTDYPGLYFVGLHWLHKLKSGLFLGLGEDATYVADHLAARPPG